MGHVPDAERDGVAIEAAIGDGQLLGVGADPVESDGAGRALKLAPRAAVMAGQLTPGGASMSTSE